jgi:hypothetical protein
MMKPFRGLLVEAAVSLSLIVALEVVFRRLLKAIDATHQQAEQEGVQELDDGEQELQDKIDEWNEEHGIKITGHAFNAIDQYEDREESPK